MNNYPQADIWHLVDQNRDSQYYRRDFSFDFSFFKSEEIKTIIKEYIWTNYSTGNRIPYGLQSTLKEFKYFDRFCRQNSVHSLRTFSNSLADDFRSFLRVSLSSTTGRPLAYSYQRHCFSALRTLIDWCRVFLPDVVPEKQIFTGSEYRQTHSGLKIGFIPDEILKAVNEALKTEDNPNLKYGFIILECTGMRVGDLLLLEAGCISEHPIAGCTISWFDHKNRKKRDNLPVPFECKAAVDHMLQLTAAIREWAADAERDRLFIYKPQRGRNKKPIVTVSEQVFAKWCRNFCEKHNILDSGGNIYRVTSHMFRRTLATDMLSKGANLKVIQEVLGHTLPATTKKYYADVKDTGWAEMFSKIGILGNIQQVSGANLPVHSELQWFHDNCTGKARLSDGYCTLPIQEGKPCGRFLNRQKCYLCSRYITTLEDLGAHKKHLAELQETLDTNIYGEHYAAHIVPTTLALKEIIRRLEKIKDEQ